MSMQVPLPKLNMANQQQRTVSAACQQSQMFGINDSDTNAFQLMMS
jgi:hypothetical protein